MASLTKRQKEIFDFIEDYIKKEGFSPTFEEIRKHFNLHALSTVHQHIRALSEKGFISQNRNSSRGLDLRKSGIGDLKVPVVGAIAAGKPIEAIESLGGTVTVAERSLPKNADYYALRVKGDSMINEGIFNGDTVIIKKQSNAENGQTVVAIIDDNEATLKKFYREKNRVRLQPANQNMLPLFRKEVQIRGVVVKIIRDFGNSEPETEERDGFRTLDLFAGIGGIRLGFEKAGFTTVFSNDFDDKCKHTYDLNFKHSKLIVEDIKKINIEDLPEFDFLLGGFPCQAFSIAGYREGFNDKKGRGNLFFDIAKIIKARQPRGFLLENVKNLKNHDNGKTFKIISDTLASLGYYIKTEVLNSMDYGNIPQNRERIFIVGFKDKEEADRFEFPNPTKLKTKVADLLEKDVDEKYYYNGKPLHKKLKPHIKSKNTVYQWRRKYVRENKKGVCPTLTANMGMGGHNVPIIYDGKGIRKLTPFECAMIQGYPKSYKLPKNVADSDLYKQVGNSVSVPVIHRIAKNMMKAVQN